MTKVIQCSQAGLVCRAKVRGETDEEVLDKALDHARDKHGVDVRSSKTLTGYLRSLIGDEGKS